MADIPLEQRNSHVTILGNDEAQSADVIEEDGERKLLVKSTSVPIQVGNLVFKDALNGANNNMAVNGSGTPVEFTIDADATADTIVNGLAFSALDGGIKIDTFLGQNSALTNGLLVQVKSEDVTFEFEPITSTQEFDSQFAWGDGRSYELIFASGNDSMVSRFGPTVPFLLKAQGTFATDDFIKVIVRDNLSSINQLRLTLFGALDV